MKNAIQALALFGSELLANPGPVGAAVPSSPQLAKRIASWIPTNPDGYVVELGAGTGAVTSALLDRGIPSDRILPVELSARMADHLQRRFPHINVLSGDATGLRALLDQRAAHANGRVSHVVSSLPLRSLPVATVARIAREIHQILPPGGAFIQFTYHLACRGYRPLERFERCASSIIWLNLPPARVDVYRPRPA
jgi:phosphatidylethanolamine/phosphatidyl-N-methylethanolamine N-methyltransferase